MPGSAGGEDELLRFERDGQRRGDGVRVDVEKRSRAVGGQRGDDRQEAEAELFFEDVDFDTLDVADEAEVDGGLFVLA